MTPMIQQYLAIKEKHKDCMLFYRLGDFYEMFFDDAVEGAAILKIALTSRSRAEETRVPMCGVPFHSADSYIQKLLDAGKKIAICEQTSDPETSKGIVDREVVRILTPALRVNHTISSEAHYLAAIYLDKETSYFELSYVDISTGQCKSAELHSEQDLFNELCRVEPKELVWPAIYKEEKILMMVRKVFPKILVNFVEILRAYSPQDDRLTKATSALFYYLKQNRYDFLPHVEKIDRVDLQKTMKLNPSTIRNLELIERSYDHVREGSLFWLLDKTDTAMGRRLLKQWILYPLLDVSEIQKRQRDVQTLFKNHSLRSEIKTHLKSYLDLERLLSRLAFDSSNARDMVVLRDILGSLPLLYCSLKELSLSFVPKDPLLFFSLLDELKKAIIETPPLSIREGGMFKEGYNPELDELIHLMRDGKEVLASIEKREKERTGISSLKVKFNQVFGYYIEITNVHLNSVPPDYIRKQTLVNCERFITPELKEYENKILTADDRRKKLEYELFQKLRQEVLKNIKNLFALASLLSELDSSSSLAEVASEKDYVCPDISLDDRIEIIEGRHPVIESLSQERFVPNDVLLDNENRLLMITGPNMAGKSTVMRQTALIVLMAQMGSFVPAKKAVIGIIDQIFTRVGAHDNIMSGDSTFMVEMKETSQILAKATSKSLILLDEIGRGTSTFDGMSIAWAVANYIHDEVRAKTLFATHYHELTDLAREKSKIKNFYISVREMNGDIVFLRKLLPGAMRRSYGIEVAKLAELPEVVIAQAKEVLAKLEKKGSPTVPKSKVEETLSLFT